MGRSWCADLPRVTPPLTEAKRITLVVPYYECPQFFAVQQAGWRAYPEALRAKLSIIVVDDGSPTPAPVSSDPIVRHFRIQEDRRWNWIAARNIGAYQADDGWLLLTDMDHVVTAETLAAVIHGGHDAGTIYGFARVEHTGACIEPHKNSWLLTREMFWTVGGYDERLSGYYGTDGDWRRRCAATAPMAILTAPLVRHEYVADASVRRYARKQPIDAAVSQIVAARGAARPKTLSFPYERVTA